MNGTEQVKLLILRELLRRNVIGGAHTPLANVTHYLPDMFLHDKKGQKSIEKGVKELVNLGWVLVLQKRTGKGSDLHISLNPRLLKEISAHLQKHPMS